MDRNNDDFSVDTGELVSLSARRAWIEMTRPSDSDVDSAVALRKESVDRNDFPAG